MSLLPNQTNVNQDTYFFLLVDAKVINTSTINANTGTYDKLFVNTISTGSVLVGNISTLTASISSINTNNISSGTGFISSLKADSIIVSSLIGQTASISSIFVNNISSGSITTGSINGNSNFDASKWYLYPAQGTVSATLGPFSAPQYDIVDFRNINCRTLTTTQNVECGNTINGLVGNLGALNCPDILMSPGDKVARLDCYGTNLLLGDNALFVEGGTTLTGGGIIHGTTIGALRDPLGTGVDLVRIDVLPAGLALNSATFITQNAGGAINVAAGGALSLAGGSYIEYNSDQHYFINTSAGNDFTDIYVGNIFPAYNGSANLRINGGGQGSRGVELSNVKSLYLQDGQSSFISGSPSTVMTVGAISSVSISTNVLVADYLVGLKQLVGLSTTTQDIQLYSAIPLPWDNTFTYDPPVGLSDPRAGRAEYLGNTYDCVVRNLNVNPSINIPNWLNTETYYPNNYAYVGAGVGTYRCIAFDLPNPLPPNQRPSNWVFFNPSNSISALWTLNNSIIESGITGDEYSYIRVGSATVNTLNTSNITLTGLSSIAISTNSIVANTISNISTFTQDIQLNSSIPLPWNSLTPYSVGDRAEVGDYYTALANNLNLDPTQPIPLWNNTLPYYPNNYAFVALVGSYRCIAYQPPPVPYPPNGNPGAWVAFNPTDSITNVWAVDNTSVNSGITGDKFSYIRVGSGYFDNLITSTINVSSITATNISSITAENITTEFLRTTFINSIPGGNENINITADLNVNITSLVDTVISGTENINLASSNLNLIASDFINAQGEWNFNDYNLSNIGHLSAVSTSIGFISTGSITASALSTGTITADTIYSYSTLTSTINFTSAKGTLIELQSPDIGTGIVLYRNVDGVQVGDTAIVVGNIPGFTINSISTIAIQAVNEIGLNSGKTLGIGATDGVLVDAPIFTVNSNATISSINTNYISTFEIYTDSIFTYYLGNPNPLAPTPIIVNNDLNLNANNINYNSIFGVNNLTASNINTTNLSTGSIIGGNFRGDSISTNNLSTGSLLVNNYIGNSISTNRISTGVLATGSVFANSYNGATSGANINMNGGVFPTSGTAKDLGASGAFRWNNFWVSTISSIHTQSSTITATNTIRGGTVATDRLTGGTQDFNTFTNNLFPTSASAGVGYGPTTAGGGYYKDGYFRSTFTSVIQPDAVAGQLSNVVRIQGFVSTQQIFTSSIFAQANVSTQNVIASNVFVNKIQPYNTTRVEANYIHSEGNVANSAIGSGQRYYNEGYFSNVSSQSLIVSTINRKLYPYTSTLNIPHSTFSITGNQAGTPILLYSNVQFLNQGFHRISQKSILSKNTGGSSADIHGNIFYTVGSFPSTPSITDGYSALPFVNQDNASTFTTLMTEFYVSTPTTRNILYYDATANNYTARLYMGTLFDTYTPQTGINPERIPANIL